MVRQKEGRQKAPVSRSCIGIGRWAEDVTAAHLCLCPFVVSAARWFRAAQVARQHLLNPVAATCRCLRRRRCPGSIIVSQTTRAQSRFAANICQAQRASTPLSFPLSLSLSSRSALAVCTCCLYWPNWHGPHASGHKNLSGNRKSDRSRLPADCNLRLIWGNWGTLRECAASWRMQKAKPESSNNNKLRKVHPTNNNSSSSGKNNYNSNNCCKCTLHLSCKARQGNLAQPNDPVSIEPCALCTLPCSS